MENKINLHEQLASVTEKYIDAICGIKKIPKGLLPHIVYVEEESDSGYPAYNQYKLIEIHSSGSCVLLNPKTNEKEKRELNEINVDWLSTVWNYYSDLKIESEKKELFVFLYPKERFNRNATDEEIITDYEADQEQDPCVEKYTPDEFAAIINDNGINYQEYFTRFIYY